MTNCAIVSPRSKLHPVLIVAIPGEHHGLICDTSAFRAADQLKKILPFSLHFYFTGKHFVIFKKQIYFNTFP